MTTPGKNDKMYNKGISECKEIYHKKEGAHQGK